MFIDLLKKRKSARHYHPDKIEPDKITALIEAALLSPTSRNLRPWEFIVVTDSDLLEKLSKAKQHGSDFLKGAPLGIVVIADPNTCDVWVEDTSIASTNIQMAAESLGLRSCWIQIRKRMHTEQASSEAYVKDVLAIPDNYAVESIIAIGYADIEAATINLSYEKVHSQTYGNVFNKE